MPVPGICNLLLNESLRGESFRIRRSRSLTNSSRSIRKLLRPRPGGMGGKLDAKIAG